MKILVPIDYSEHSRSLLKFALAVAPRLSGEVTVVHAVEIQPLVPEHLTVTMPDGSHRRIMEVLREESDGAMRDFMKSAEPLGGASPAWRLLSGPAATAIVNEAVRGGFDLILIGTQGRTGIGHLVLGSVAEKVVRTSPIPVLTVPKEQPGTALKTAFEKILVPVDFAPEAKLALERALALGAPFNAATHVLHVWEAPAYFRADLTVWSAELSGSLERHFSDEAEKGMRDFLADAHMEGRADVTHEVRSGTPYAAILETSESGRFDLIVIGTHGRTGLSHFLLGSVAEKVVRLAKCPVLTVRHP